MSQSRIDVKERRAVDQVGPDPDKVRQHVVGGVTAAGPTS
jgi:hypothetical protein